MAMRYLPSASVPTTSFPFDTATPETPGSESWYTPSLLRSSNTMPRAISAAGTTVAIEHSATNIIRIKAREFINILHPARAPPDHGTAGGFQHSQGPTYTFVRQKKKLILVAISLIYSDEWADREDPMSKKVLVATEKPFSPAAVEQLSEVFKAANYDVQLLESYTDKADLLAAVVDADAMIIRSDKVTAEVLDAAGQLKIVVRAGAGYDNIDCAKAAEKNVVAMNTPGQNSNAVAELVFGMMVMNARNNYNGKPGTELRGKKIGIHAFGNVGIYVAKVAHGFGMEVFAFDPFVDDEAIKVHGVTPVSSVEELYETCQYVSLHIPETPQTMKSINFELLSKMPEGGTLINTARLGVIDEDGLMKMFAERDDFVYLSDIAPTCKDDIVSKYDETRYFFTPKKMGAQTAEANINAGVAAATQIVNFFENGDVTFKVN